MGDKPNARVDAMIRSLWAQNLNVDAICRVLNLEVGTVARASKRLGLPKRHQGVVMRVSKEYRAGTFKPDLTGGDASDRAALDDADGIAATGGRYSALGVYAEKHGLTSQQALQAWHRHRAGR